MKGPMKDLAWPEPSGWPDDVTHDRLIGDVYIYQRKGGHRTGTDDVLTAWFAAARFGRTPDRYLDLGCGIGSVLLMTAHRLRPSSALGIEAQPQSIAMLERTLAELPSSLDLTISARQSDFRDEGLLSGQFDLVTGSPPYFPLSDGVLPADAQRRACRFEARGGIEAYCDAAARALSEQGRFYVVFQTTWNQRVLSAAQASDLHLTARADARMRVDRPEPFLTVYEFQRAPAALACTELSIRDQAGEFTETYRAARKDLGVE